MPNLFSLYIFSIKSLLSDLNFVSGDKNCLRNDKKKWKLIAAYMKAVIFTVKVHNRNGYAHKAQNVLNY